MTRVGYFRPAYGMTLRDIIRNEDIRSQPEEKNINEEIKGYQSWWKQTARISRMLLF